MASLKTVGLCALGAFVAYAAYFDYKRRRDPDFKQKLVARRNSKNAGPSAGSRGGVQAPNDPERINQLFLMEMQAAQELLEKKNEEAAIGHFCNAIQLYSVVRDVTQLMQMLSQSLPQPVLIGIVKEMDARSKNTKARAAGEPIKEN